MRDIMERNRGSSDCVVIGDIKGSKGLRDWQNVITKLTEILAGINTKFSDVIVVHFTLTVGDEFQGVSASPEKAFEILNFIRSKLQQELELSIYCAVGIGDIERPLGREIGKMRGSAFYRARDALELCKRKKRSILIKSSDALSRTDLIINLFLRFIEAIESSLTKRQREIVNYYRIHRDYTYEQLGKHFGFSKQAASQFLKAANWEVITEGDDLIKKLLRDMYLFPSKVKTLDK